MVLCAIFSCGTPSGCDKGINMARIPSITTSQREKVRILSTTGSVVNILSPEKRLNCGIVTIQIWFRPENLGHQKCGSVEKLQADLEVAAKRDERARGRELKRVAGERERQLWEEIESKKQIIDEPGVKVIDISFHFESVVSTKLSNTGFVLHLLRSK